MHIPATNAIRSETGSQDPQYPDNPVDKRYIILYPEDYQGHGTDVAGNIALLVNEENAREIKRLAEDVIENLESDDDE